MQKIDIELTITLINNERQCFEREKMHSNRKDMSAKRDNILSRVIYCSHLHKIITTRTGILMFVLFIYKIATFFLIYPGFPHKHWWSIGTSEPCQRRTLGTLTNLLKIYTKTLIENVSWMGQCYLVGNHPLVILLKFLNG